ncbi:hypothetical protein PVAP13_5KG346314 [Panicum virgatum]|uniref:Uncharacterized protein n=1 Tax=Panicum virgatum TaxID=38727 RepID=A0A8T0SN71_PANVG|nr:hypothetical protein PVAP13_5KG346314 [Panicum virgatum]
MTLYTLSLHKACTTVIKESSIYGLSRLSRQLNEKPAGHQLVLPGRSTPNYRSNHCTHSSDSPTAARDPVCTANILVPENPLKATILPAAAARAELVRRRPRPATGRAELVRRRPRPATGRAELVRRRPHPATARADAPHHPVDGSPNAMRLREDKKETETEDNIF